MRHLDQPWLLTPTGFARLQRDQDQRKALKAGATATDLIIEYPSEPSVLDENGIAHLHVTGVLGYGLDWIDRALGNTDLIQLRCDLRAALAAGARGIMLHVNSPGGGVTGLLELAIELRAIACGLPVHAYADICACSAGYWLSCAATRFTTSLTAAVGSIGIYLPWVDKSLAFTAAGLADQPFTNDGAIYKGAGHGPALTPDQRAQIQGEIDRLGEMFTSFVATCRPQARFDAMRGQTFHGLDAPAVGLTDGLGTREQAYLDLCLAAGVESASIAFMEYGLPIPSSTFEPLTAVPAE